MYRSKKSITQPANFVPPDLTLMNTLGSVGAQADTGEFVTKSSALQSPTFHAALKLVSNRIGCVSKPVYRDHVDKKMGREKLKQHNVFRLLNHKANKYTSAIDLFTSFAIDLCLGNGYIMVERDQSGDYEPIALHNVNNLSVEPIALYENAKLVRLFYSFHTDEGVKVVPAEDMIHVKQMPVLLDTHGIEGVDLIQSLRNNFSLGHVIEKYEAKYFKNGTHVNKWLKIPQWLDDAQKAELKEAIHNFHEGMDNAHRIMTLSGGTELMTDSGDNSTAQLHETHRLLERQKAVILGVPGNLVGDREGLSQYGNLSEENLSYLTHTLDPLYDRICCELEEKLLTTKEREAGLYIEFDRNSILKGDPEKSQQQLEREMNTGGISFEQRLQKNNMSLDGEGNYFVSANVKAWRPGQVDLDLAQITTLMQSVTSKQLPPETAKALIAATYPALGEQRINDIVNPCIGFEAPKPDVSSMNPMQEEQPQPEPQEEVQRSEIVVKNTIERLRRRFLKSGEIDDLAIEEAFEGINTESFKRALDPLREELPSVLREQRKQIMEERWNSQELLSTILS